MFINVTRIKSLGCVMRGMMSLLVLDRNLLLLDRNLLLLYGNLMLGNLLRGHLLLIELSGISTLMYLLLLILARVNTRRYLLMLLWNVLLLLLILALLLVNLLLLLKLKEWSNMRKIKNIISTYIMLGWNSRGNPLAQRPRK